MSEQRPRVTPQLIAALIDAAPDRVRRRLDRAPNSASEWNWQSGDTWTVDTGGETVTLPRERIDSLDQIGCTCLLSPKCFHILACLTTLEVAADDAEIDDDADKIDEEPSDEDDHVQPTESQRQAAAELANGIERLLNVGVANAGVVVQSSLLRAAHQCRAEGLHRAAAVGLRVIAGAGQLRARSAEADPDQLAGDIADALETTQRIRNQKRIAGFWIGTARRKQRPVRPRRLHGLLAEPIVTRSGFAGAAVYFLGEDDCIYSASDVRPGDAQHARDAYRGGIEIGSMIQPARQLARGLYLGTDLTASADGRLGRGKSIKIVEQGQSSWDAEPIQRRFQTPLPEQWNSVVEHTTLPPDGRPAGWDLVFLEGTILGAVGAELLMQLKSGNQHIRLGIANESEALIFRENLRMLAHAPGLTLQLVARLDLDMPGLAYPLAVASATPNKPRKKSPRMELPDAMHGRICLGFDEIQRKYLLNAESNPVVLGEKFTQSYESDPLETLRRRWIAMMLAGTAARGANKPTTVSREVGTLNQIGFETGAALLNSLVRSDATKSTSTELFLAVGVYLRSTKSKLAKTQGFIDI